MNHPILAIHLVRAIESDRRRARHRPTAWTEASATLFRAPWADFSLRELWNRIRADARTLSPSNSEERELREASQKV